MDDSTRAAVLEAVGRDVAALWDAVTGAAGEDLETAEGAVRDGVLAIGARLLEGALAARGTDEGVASKERAKRLAATLVVVWGEGQAAPWLLLTDLAPDAVEGRWYGLRTWIELGFRALKLMGWHWERTRRTAPDRIARHWLALAIATLLDVAVGARLEEADWRGIPPGRLRRAHPTSGPAAAGERLRPRAGMAACPGYPRHALVARPVAAARGVARPASRPVPHPP